MTALILSTQVPAVDEVTKTFITSPLASSPTGVLRRASAGYLPMRAATMTSGLADMMPSGVAAVMTSSLLQRSYSLTGSFEPFYIDLDFPEEEIFTFIEHEEIGTVPSVGTDYLTGWYLSTYMPQHHTLSSVFDQARAVSLIYSEDTTLMLSSYIQSKDTLGCLAAIDDTEGVIGSLSALYNKELHPVVRYARVVDKLDTEPLHDGTYKVYLTETAKCSLFKKTDTPESKVRRVWVDTFSLAPIFTWSSPHDFVIKSAKNSTTYTDFTYSYSTSGVPIADVQSVEQGELAKRHFRPLLSGLLEDTAPRYGFNAMRSL